MFQKKKNYEIIIYYIKKIIDNFVKLFTRKNVLFIIFLSKVFSNVKIKYLFIKLKMSILI